MRVGLNLAGATKRSFHSSPTVQQKKQKVGIIGARGYTGQELIKLLDQHRNLELVCVSSRELVGRTCDYYTSSRVVYSNLSPTDVGDASDIDCWVMALPNGVCKPFVDQVTKTQKINNTKVVVDLSADYRFTKEWQYGLQCFVFF